MLSSEERSGLLFTLVGGALLVVGLLFALGFFSDATPAAGDGAPASAATLPALKLGAVRGRALDARSGFGLAARTVEVRGVEGISDHWLADPDAAAPGAFEVRGLPAGRRCTLVIGVDGYLEQTREAEIVAGSTVELGDVALLAKVALIGQVVDASGLALGPARVELASPAASGVALASVVSDANGNFRFDQLPPGDYSLSATTEAGDASFAATAIDARRGGEQRGLQLELFPTAALRGRFELPIGSPPLVGVVAQGRRGRVTGDGSFEVTGLRAGVVRLVALVEVTRGVTLELAAPLEAAVIAIDPATATEVAELADERAAELALLAAPAAAATAGEAPAARPVVVVRVVDPTGARLAGARVELVPDDPTLASRLRFTSRAGECVVRELPAATAWRIDVRHGVLAGSLPIRIEGDATREAVIALAPAALR